MGRLRRKRRGLPEEASAGPGSADLREAERGECGASNNSSVFYVVCISVFRWRIQ